MVSHSKVESTNNLDFPSFNIYHIGNGTTVVPISWVLEILFPKTKRGTCSARVSKHITQFTTISETDKMYILAHMDIYNRTRITSALRWVTLSVLFQFLRDIESDNQFHFSFDIEMFIEHVKSYVPSSSPSPSPPSRLRRSNIRVVVGDKRKRESEPKIDQIFNAITDLKDIIRTDNRRDAMRLYMNTEDFQTRVRDAIAKQETLVMEDLKRKVDAAEAQFRMQKDAEIVKYLAENKTMLERQAINELKQDPLVQEKARIALMRERPVTKRVTYNSSSVDDMLRKIRGNE